MPGLFLRAIARRHGGRAAAGRRCDRDRQDQPRPVRDGPRRRALALRYSQKSDARRSGSGRIELRFGSRRVDGHGTARTRHRHRRVRPRAGDAQQYCRPEAEPGSCFDRGRGAGVPHARLRFGVLAHGRRCGNRAQGHGWPRRGRSVFAQPHVRRPWRVSAPIAAWCATQRTIDLFWRQGAGSRLRDSPQTLDRAWRNADRI